jgi:hypothetical protein
MVADEVPGTRVEFAEGASPDARDYRVDFSRISGELGFATRWTARDGVRELLAAYQTVGLTLEEFEGPRYQRIAHVRKLLAEGVLDEELRFTAKSAAAALTAVD